MTALATSRIRSVTAAIADSSTTELGHGVAGSWLPGSAYSRGLAMSPRAADDGPSTMCSLIITASNPASSASRAQRTRRGRSRPDVMVQFSLMIRHILGAVMSYLPWQPGTSPAIGPCPAGPRPACGQPAARVIADGDLGIGFFGQYDQLGRVRVDVKDLRCLRAPRLSTPQLSSSLKIPAI